jgi:mono/diheme cytochrome c family protein
MHFAVIVVVLFLISVPFAVAQEGGNAAKGLAYARTQCAECHAVERTDGFSPGTRAASFVHIANTPGVTATALLVWFQTPHRTMPNLIIPEADRRDIIAYIVSLRAKP